MKLHFRTLVSITITEIISKMPTTLIMFSAFALMFSGDIRFGRLLKRYLVILPCSGSYLFASS